MILIDYSAIAIGNIVTQKLDPDENLIRHMILNSIRLYRKKFHKKYGEIVLAVDAGGNWRKEVFPQYKANRKTSRDSDPEYWAEVFRLIDMVKKEIEENFPYKVIKIHGCEADDIIGTLCEHTQEFGQNEPVMIISADKDFAQLQKYSNVEQFSPMTKRPIVEKDPHRNLFEHLCKGDGGDGVPNILSPDDVFVTEGTRQTPMRKKRIDELYNSKDLQSAMTTEEYRNFQRNKKMIDLSSTPDHLKQEIINRYVNGEVAQKGKIMNYFIKHRCKHLIEELGDFT